ncbi:alpha/beta fold hydrolase [Parasedimentitalea maritima]|uniref:Alpha/beta fold hydrolase n=1 Tax=Parasedimentitalea maritima TaxID=2578117 RepID=A0ABY2URI2_9RHOB|nr:alpha/beta fold hydrolase [Zongyanglinia marina]TLP59364.1 alpha/beta fold hydrolase [Zongyanglinia marina]
MTVINSLALAGLALPAAFLSASHLKTRRLARRAETLVPPVGQLQMVPGGSIHYVEMGPREAPPLVLIHGLSGQLQHFTYALAELLTPDFRVIILDRPGCGYSTRNQDHLATLSEQARMIQSFLDLRNVDQPILCGHSLGGAIALAMALNAPQKIRGLALLAPLTHPVADAGSFKGLIIHSPFMRRLIAQTVAIPAAQRTATEVLQQIFAPSPCPEDFLIQAGGALGLRPKSFVAASSDATLASAGIGEQSPRYASELKTPGAILFGSQDAVLDVKTNGNAMEQYGLHCETEPNQGHMLPITAPARCNQFIRNTVDSRC